MSEAARQMAEAERLVRPAPPAETDETRDNIMYAPPSAPPKEWAAYMKNGLDCKIYETYTANKVPYKVIKGLVDDDWGDLAALVHRFPNTEVFSSAASTNSH